MKCIYKILNRKNNLFYVGSTKNFNKRKQRHIKTLNDNKHHSYKLQKEWNINKDLFDFTIIEEVSDEKLLVEREQYWIDLLKPFYNISPKASSSLGVKRREETKERVRQANLGLKHPEWRNKIKSIAQGGENHWTKKKKFSEESKKRMSNAQKELYKKGYISHRIGKKMSNEFIQRLKSWISKPVEQYTKDGVLVRCWASAVEAEKNGYNSTSISLVANGKAKTHKKYLWKFKNKK